MIISDRLMNRFQHLFFLLLNTGLLKMSDLLEAGEFVA